jgi:pentatricopeptide repeat protein
LNIIPFSSAIDACAKKGRWREALTLLEEVKTNNEKLSLDLKIYGATIDACAKAGKWKQAVLCDRRELKV